MSFLIASIIVLSFVSISTVAPAVGSMAFLALFPILLSTLSVILTVLSVFLTKDDFEKNCFIGGLVFMITQLPLPKKIADKFIGYIVEKVLGFAGGSGVTLGWMQCLGEAQ